jgi:hypothetical protein
LATVFATRYGPVTRLAGNVLDGEWFQRIEVLVTLLFEVGQ